MEKIKIRDVFTISGRQISKIYEDNKMTVHFQGMSKTLQFPQTIALEGAPTCSLGISPEGLYNRLNDAGRLILLNQNAIQLGSAPFIKIAADPNVEDERDEYFMLTTRDPNMVEGPDDVPALKNYYHPPVPEEKVTISLATPLAEITYDLGKISVTRLITSPLFSGNDQTLIPISVEEFVVENISDKTQVVTMVIPRPSLVNLQEKELKPTDQDTVYICSASVKGQVHEAFNSAGIRGVVMGNQECPEKMAIAVPEIEGVDIDIHPHFCLNHLKQDLLLNDDGSFYEKRKVIPHQDYGAAISLHFTLEPKASLKIPFAIALDFPQQRFIDGKEFERKYVKLFQNQASRPIEMIKVALENYPEWLNRTLTIQNRIYELIQKSPAYQNDREGALRLTRLIFNEFSCPISNACVWIKDGKGNERARFLECFDYAYINPSDVDWYSMVMLFLFPKIEEELCQSFVDSILAENPTPRFYHLHASFVEARQHFEKYPEEYEGISLTQIYDATKVKGSVAHDLGALPKGHPLRNVSDYAWYNNNYWVDLFPKLATRVLRNVKFTGNTAFLKKNWETLKFGFDHLQELDFDGDGIPEGYPGEVKNTFDNLTLFGVDAYDATIFMAGCYAMIKMAEIMQDTAAKKQYEEIFDKVSKEFEKLWRDTKNSHGKRLQYYVTCFDPKTGETNTDVWINQLDAIWALLAMGEESFIPEERIKQILKTVYDNNRTYMGWAMCRTENGGKVESEQGQDVYTTSNYVFAQLLDYYGMTAESKEVYKAMDRVIFEYGNTLISPDNLRAELEQEAGESAPRPHYIVAAYPRPGAILTQIVLQYIKEKQQQTESYQVDSESLKKFALSLMK
ncbi:MAG TPA: GH116 family glycosyl hydrolase [Candidatus Marinimicrobia bacterium]|nr:GH116 family glycosyl hydrolase [Candidatus Neomarinimicrobiota bacterium]HRS52129.1 GH116 family glycosyl hydrolase [Candidatus Neomarinimicrobiota bacterium]HRU92494.1 GH116 family glycosyl hydrolase [Candidatus Neomarinimicrobiota bacterium]